MAIIGISANIMAAEKRVLYQDKALQMIESSLIQTVEALGHTPIILPVPQNLKEQSKNLVNLIDGLILSGGTDVSSELYGEELLNERWQGQMNRDLFEIELIKRAKEKNIPILGICRGHQILNVAYKGSLYQDVVSLRENSHEHRNQEKYDKLGHPLKIVENSELHKLWSKNEVYVNSVHHQCIKELGEGLDIMAYSDDGIIEAIRDPKYKFVWGVQWHPEWMSNDIEQQKLWQNFSKSLDL